MNTIQSIYLTCIKEHKIKCVQNNIYTVKPGNVTSSASNSDFNKELYRKSTEQEIIDHLERKENPFLVPYTNEH